MSSSEISSGRSSLTIWGDSVVGQALMLLLRSFGYEVKFLFATLPLAQALALKGSSLLLLTPTPQLAKKDRQAFLRSLRDSPESATIPVLELRVLGEETHEDSTERDASWHYVPWPCRAEELQEWIEALISWHNCGEPEAKGLWKRCERGASEHYPQSLTSQRSASG